MQTIVQPKTQIFSPDDPRLNGLLRLIDPPVSRLYSKTNNLEDLLARPKVAVVGTRKVSPYGRYVTEKFVSALAGQGIVIVSGLAYGIDSIAHQAALDADGLTIAVLPGPVESPYPVRHAGLSERIIDQGGALLSEYPAGMPALKHHFVDRNRIVAGISSAVLVTEAGVKSGTMHTARFALDNGIDVFAVPGNITSPGSEGANNLLRDRAHIAVSPGDILTALNLQPQNKCSPVSSSNCDEQLILDLLGGDVHDGDELLVGTQLTVSKFNQAVTMLEITGKIRALGANKWAIRA